MVTDIDVRYAVFPNEAGVWQPVFPGDSLKDIPNALIDAFATANSIASIAWNTPGSAGLPVVPYEVSALRSVWTGNFSRETHAQLDLGPGNGWTQRFSFNVPPISIAPGAFYVLCRSAEVQEPGTALFAVDQSGRELPDSRVELTEEPVVLFGPGIFGVQSTGDVTLNDVTIGWLSGTEGFEPERLAQVAPFFGRETLFGDSPVFGPQQILGFTLGSAKAHLARLWLDAVARNLVTPPQQAELDSLIHRGDPLEVANGLLQTPLIAMLGQNYAAHAADPSFALTAPLVLPDGSSVDATASATAMMQLHSRFGPVEATTLGHGIALPDQGLPDLTSEALYSTLVNEEQPFPLPIYKVAGLFPDPQQAQPGMTLEDLVQVGVVAERIARFIPRAARPRVQAVSAGLFPPLIKDGPAKTNVRLELAGNTLSTSHFLERQPEDGAPELVMEDEPRGTDMAGDEIWFPKQMMTTPNRDHQDSRFPNQIMDPDQPAPLTGPSKLGYLVHRRDEFGRWPEPAELICDLDPWPVQSPTLTTIQPRVAGEALWLDLEFGWDWKKRSPRDIRFGILLGDPGSAVFSELTPDSGVLLPAYGASPRDLILRFQSPDPDALPEVIMMGLPVSATLPSVSIVPPPEPDAAGGPLDPVTGEQPDFDRLGFLDRLYRLTLEIGPANAVFTADQDPRQIGIVADATEQVSGARQSEKAGPRSAPLFDPRPPELVTEPIALRWTARPDEEGHARATLPTPQVTVGGDEVTFQLWRCHEASIIDLLASSSNVSKPLIEAILSQDDKQVRLDAMVNALRSVIALQPEIEQAVTNLFEASDAQVTDDGIELVFSASQGGLEFVMVTATSKNAVTSVKPSIFEGVAYAVPVRRRILTPVLKAYPRDDSGLFELSGFALFAVAASDPIDDAEVHFFWEKNGSYTSEVEMFLPFMEVNEVPPAELGTWFNDPADLLGNIPFEHVRLFLASLPEDWHTRDYAVELRFRSDNPALAAPSRRSNAVSCFRAPNVRPLLSIVEDAEPVWQLRVMHMPPMGGLGVTLTTDSGEIISRGTADLTKLPAVIGTGTETVSVTGSASDREILTVEVGPGLQPRQVEIAIVDPFNRGDKLTLA